MPDDPILQSQREFINLLLRNKTLVEEWINSSLEIDHFDISFHKVLHGIIDAAEKGVLLTRQSYIDYLAKYGAKKREIVREESCFGSIYISTASVNDYPMLASRILDHYISQVSVQHIKEFGQLRQTKGNIYAINNLAEKLGSLLDVTQRESLITFESVLDFAPTIQ